MEFNIDLLENVPEFVFDMCHLLSCFKHQVITDKVLFHEVDFIYNHRVVKLSGKIENCHEYLIVNDRPIMISSEILISQFIRDMRSYLFSAYKTENNMQKILIDELNFLQNLKTNFFTL